MSKIARQLHNFDSPAKWRTDSARKSENSLEQIRSVIQKDLEDTKTFSISALDSDIPLVKEIGHHFHQYGGKKLRPITVLLSARALGFEDGFDHIILATILETIHVATLLHDDVVDDSKMRRGRASANSIWGNPASVLVGDFLYSRTFELLVEVRRMEVFEVMARTVRIVSEGEIMQLVQLQAAQTTEADYFDTIERKTAALFSAGAQMGAIITDQSDEIRKRMADFGTNLGIAFQLIDDCLDYAGDAEKIGKSVGDDLAEGKLTLPLIHARNNCDKIQRNAIDAAIENPEQADIQQVCEIVANSGSLEYTVGLARQYGIRANQNIEFLPDTPYRDALFKLVEFVCSRDY